MTDDRLEHLPTKKRSLFVELQNARWEEREDDAERLDRALKRVDRLIQEGQHYDPKF